MTVGSTTLNAQHRRRSPPARPSTWRSAAPGPRPAAAPPSPRPPTRPTWSPRPTRTTTRCAQSIVVGRGAAVPYVEYEAEAARYQGTLLEADPLRTFGHTNFATESSGRQSVRLNSTGPVRRVHLDQRRPTRSWCATPSRTRRAAAASRPRSACTSTAPFVRKLTLSSRNSWLYGTTDDTESLSNTPPADARRLFDESHALLSQSYPAGTRFKLQRDAATPRRSTSST